MSPKTNEPALCTAEQCPYEGAHYDSVADAWRGEEEAIASAFQQFPKTIELSSNLGSAKVVDGDLSNPEARLLLSSGLCGDLALAIHEETGAKPYFLSFSVSDPAQLEKLFKEDPDNIIRASSHVVVASPSAPDSFLDAYGQYDEDELEERWDGAIAIEGTPEMLRHFADENSAKRLKNFALAALKLDRRGESYEMSEDVFADLDDEDEWGDED